MKQLMTTTALEETIATEIAVAVYFAAPNCGVCEALRPKVEALFSEEFPAVKFLYIKIEESPEIAAIFSVFSAPTLLVFFEGKEFLRKVRLMGIQELRDKIERPYKMVFNV
ncbi:thioredoxin family protein [Aequorivita flava]|uniref:Thioredoxin family protein n=1 Tax=Aequorivita flava TaxID=3114371 RepID=A0AB35YW50_9FLAO